MRIIKENLFLLPLIHASKDRKPIAMTKAMSHTCLQNLCREGLSAETHAPKPAAKQIKKEITPII